MSSQVIPTLVVRPSGPDSRNSHFRKFCSSDKKRSCYREGNVFCSLEPCNATALFESIIILTNGRIRITYFSGIDFSSGDNLYY